MKLAKRDTVVGESRTADVLLHELREECQNVVELIRQLEANRTRRKRDELLGELSAAVLHLHAHTKGLDQVLCDID